MGRRQSVPDLRYLSLNVIDSKTYLTRKRTRRTLEKAVREFLRMFPPLDKNGEPIEKKRKPVYKCPLCKTVVLYSWSGVVIHLRNKHNIDTTRRWTEKFPVEKCFGCDEEFTVRGIPRHLANLHRKKELDQHVIIGASYAMFGGPENESN